MIDPTDTSCCPIGYRCELHGCTGEMTVVVRSTARGPICLTVCLDCARCRGGLTLAESTIQRFVFQHAAHLNQAGKQRVLRVRRGVR